MVGEIHVSTTMRGSITTTPRCRRYEGPHRLVECTTKRREWVPTCIICGGPHLPTKCPNQKPLEPKCLMCKGPHRLMECPRYLQLLEEEQESDDDEKGDEVEEIDQTDEQGAQQNEGVVDEGNDQYRVNQPKVKEAAMVVECEKDDKAEEEQPRHVGIQLHKSTRVEEPMRRATERRGRCIHRRNRLRHIVGTASKKGTPLHEDAREWSKMFGIMRMRIVGAKCTRGRKPSMVHGRASVVGILMTCIAR